MKYILQLNFKFIKRTLKTKDFKDDPSHTVPFKSQSVNSSSIPLIYLFKEGVFFITLFCKVQGLGEILTHQKT